MARISYISDPQDDHEDPPPSCELFSDQLSLIFLLAFPSGNLQSLRSLIQPKAIISAYLPIFKKITF